MAYTSTGYLSDVFLDKSFRSRERGLSETIPICQQGAFYSFRETKSYLHPPPSLFHQSNPFSSTYSPFPICRESEPRLFRRLQPPRKGSLGRRDVGRLGKSLLFIRVPKRRRCLS